jgi:hypothetical protein
VQLSRSAQIVGSKKVTIEKSPRSSGSALLPLAGSAGSGQLTSML